MGERYAQSASRREMTFAHTASTWPIYRVRAVCPLAVHSLPTDFKMPSRLLSRQFQSFTLVTIFGALATGCTWIDDFFDDNVTLTDFAPVAAHVSVEFTNLPRSQLVLQPKDGQCPTMRDDIGATVDAKPMDVFIQGGKQPSGKTWICGEPTFRRNIAAADFGAASTKFVADDDTKTITVVATGLVLERSLTLTDPALPLQGGVETSFDWSVATDTIDPKLSSVDFVYDDPNLVLTAEVGLRVDGASLFIRLPTDAPAGKGTLKVDVMADVPIETCEGVAKCTGSVHLVKEIALEAFSVVPPNP